MNADEYDDIIRHLVQIAVHQDTINERLTVSIERIDVSIKRIDASIERLDTTLAHVEITQARIETLLARMLRHGSNGQEA